MGERYKIAIIGSGPGGLSAAGRAAEHGVSHILLERTDHLSDTIYRYQKGKHVMATPDILPLRSTHPFGAGTRENILAGWNDRTAQLKANVRYKAEVTGIKGERGNFQITINRSEVIEAEAVVLAIGLQGNFNKLTCEGADWERLQYQLDDPDEYEDETIVVIGAGDAGIENAVALAHQNKVIIINRSNEFTRAKDGNRVAIEEAIHSGAIQCFYDAETKAIRPGELILETKSGQEIVQCDRIIARLGANPPRRFVEFCGVVFPSDDRAALPELSPKYESNVPGLYIIGALGGYPLIKQAMNQGYEVVEFILGNPIKPADEPILEDKFGELSNRFTVDQTIDWFRESIPLLSGLTALQLREFFLDSSVLIKKPGEPIFKIGDFGSTVLMIAEGTVNVLIDPNDPSAFVSLDTGKFFGEIAMTSARPRTATVLAATQCVLVEASRRTMIKMMKSVKSVEKQILDAAMGRQLRVCLSQQISDELMAAILETAKHTAYKPGQPLFHEGEGSDGVYVIRKGALSMSQSVGGSEQFRGYAAAGSFVGEMGVVGKKKRTMTVRAATQVNATWIEAEKFLRIVDEVPEFRQRVDDAILRRLADNESTIIGFDKSRTYQFLLDQGVGEATDVLLIDETLCIGCNNCEQACAATHNGVSRLNRAAGPTFANIHVPTACRHCEDPYCMTNCPPDAIHRAQTGEVFIDDTCIGCGNCKANCPYDAIQMAYTEPRNDSLFSWLLFGKGKSKPDGGKGGSDKPKLAVKCDSCVTVDGGPSCVRACPTGAAFRVSPDEYFLPSRLT